MERVFTRFRRKKSTSATLVSGEPPVRVFVSGVIDEMRRERGQATRIIEQLPFATPWTFEYTPASSEEVTRGYLRHVREADLVIWLLGQTTSNAVVDEIREALSYDRRILAFLFPATVRDPASQMLLGEVGTRCKWVDVPTGQFARVLPASVGDEVRRRLRDEPGLGRSARVEDLRKASFGRCVNGWRGAGLSRGEAEELTKDQFVGAPSARLVPSAERPIVVLVGEIGIGKSLLAERLLQRALEVFGTSASAPIPVFLDGLSEDTRLEDVVGAACQGLGQVATQGVYLIIDDAEPLGPARFRKLLDQIRLLVARWPKSRAVVTTRPMSDISLQEEFESVPEQSSEKSLSLINRLSGKELDRFVDWPPSVKAVIGRPLFAILLATYLRAHQGAPSSPVDLLESLVKHTLQRLQVPDESTTESLEKLAIELIDRGGPIHRTETELSAIVDHLIDSGLLVQRGAGVTFALPLLTEWFAANGLRRGELEIRALASAPERLNRFRFPLMLAFALNDHETATRILAPIAAADPGFAARLVNDATKEWFQDVELAAPNYLESGRRLRDAMQAWCEGLGPLSRSIAPVHSDGTLRTVGVGVGDAHLAVSWYYGFEGLEPVESLADKAEVFRRAPVFRLRSAQLSAPAAWAWPWTLEELRSSIDGLIRQRRLYPSAGPLLKELIWETARLVTRRGSLDYGAIPIREVDEALRDLPERGTLITGGHSLEFEDERFTLLRESLAEHADLGQHALVYPWPVPDQIASRTSRWVSESYSSSRLLERTIAVYTAALRGYSDIVNTWFPKIGPRLQLFALLPAKLTGWLTIPTDAKALPSLYYYLEPLPEGSDNLVDIRLGDSPTSEPDWPRLEEAIRRFRPHAADWLGIWQHWSDVPVFQPDSATDWAYRELLSDLKQVCWA